MGKRTTRIKKLITGLMIVVMGLFMVNGALFVHIHILPDGSLISHAHPFSKNKSDPGQNNHQHSSREIFILDQLNLLAPGISMIFVLIAVTRPVTFLHPAENLQFFPLYTFAPGRAPPACMY